MLDGIETSSVDIGLSLNNLGPKYDTLDSARYFHVHRFLKGYGQEKGQFETLLYNRLSEPLTVIYLDVIPWYLKVYLHTMKLVVQEGFGSGKSLSYSFPLLLKNTYLSSKIVFI